MARFIIEVDDKVIRNYADPEQMKEKVTADTDGTHAMKVLFDVITATAIARKLDEGVTEFHITREMMDRDTSREFFDRNVSDVLGLAMMAMPDEMKKKPATVEAPAKGEKAE